MTEGIVWIGRKFVWFWPKVVWVGRKAGHRKGRLEIFGDMKGKRIISIGRRQWHQSGEKYQRRRLIAREWLGRRSFSREWQGHRPFAKVRWVFNLIVQMRWRLHLIFWDSLIRRLLCLDVALWCNPPPDVTAYFWQCLGHLILEWFFFVCNIFCSNVVHIKKSPSKIFILLGYDEGVIFYEIS